MLTVADIAIAVVAFGGGEDTEVGQKNKVSASGVFAPVSNTPKEILYDRHLQ